ncbi:ABC transporter ATP-binding protein [Fodinicurvata sediminis]|uniref:ABC transporter ATP-binding protein n=1 Tax=Fodinicurvata sediminis TaxID=1121832 RepID=UPI0003B4242F|nr:ABC transporter ATP-binding protein [Fodinicurvata sediminis]
MSTDAFLRLEGLAKRWGDHVGLRQFDLSIQRGEFIVLLGPSGCGKSTTLRLIAGLEMPSEGRLWIDGRDVTSVPPAKRGLSMVFQSYALFPHLSVAENIQFGLKVRRMPAAQRAERLARALRMTGLEGFEDRKPAQLSGGQRQRVALARTVVADHPLCLMDEPLSNLDAKLRHSVRQDIRALQQDLGMTVIYVTHDQTEAMGMADRIVLLNEGRVEQIGTPEELYEQPATLFAAGFLGSPPMTFFPITILPEALKPADTNLPDSCVVGVRPENLDIGPDSSESLSAQVENSEFLGAETLIYLNCAGRSMIARIPGRSDFDAHQNVGLTWNAEHVHLFDETTGQRLDSRGPVAAGIHDRQDENDPVGQLASQ